MTVQRALLFATLPACLILACSSSSPVTSNTTTVDTSIPYDDSHLTTSVGSVQSGDTVAVTFINVLGSSGSCDVLQRTSIDHVANATEITVTFPTGVQAGQHTLADVGAVATFRINDAACAPAHADTTTSGTLWFGQTGLTSIALDFALGKVIADNINAPTCGSPNDSDTVDAGGCVSLGPCVDSASPSCFQSGP